MICVVYGTTGELIKLAPVLVRLRERGHSWLQATTAQQVEQIPQALVQLGLPQPDVWLARGRRGSDLRANADIPAWAADVARGFVRNRARLRRALAAGPGRPLVLVHGDTMTTVLGALMGRALRVPVAHLEAGVRTWDLRHPFPEELNRRIVSRLVQLHYAPGPAAAANLRRGTVVDTGTNTIRDSLALCARDDVPLGGLPEAFGVVSLHRYELLNDRRLLRSTLEALAAASRSMPLLFIDHPVTAAAVERHGLGSLFRDGLRRVPRLDYFGFVELLRRSSFLVTDSGGSQVECYVLDLPCLVHRKVVEQPEGVGENVVVSGLDVSVLEQFLTDPGRFRRRGPLPPASPAEVVVDDLVRRGFAGPPTVALSSGA